MGTYKDDNNHTKAKRITHLFSLLEFAGNDISHAAVGIMLDDGTLTEERKLDDYIMAKYFFEALIEKDGANKQDDIKKILSRLNTVDMFAIWNNYWAQQELNE